MGTEADIETEAKSKRKDSKPRKPLQGVRLYRIEEAAYLLQMSITSVRRLLIAGKIPYRKTPAGVRFADADIEDYIGGAAERRGGADTADQRAARRARSRGMIVDPEFIDGTKKRKSRGG